MNRGDLQELKELSKLSDKLNKSGYYSLLLVYHSKLSDMLLKSALIAKKEESIKYMIAMRTYAISPEYMSMIVKAYNEIFPNKLMLNIVSGDIHKEENSIENLLWISESLNNPEKRLNYTNDWMLKFLDLCQKDIPEIVMGGHSDYTRKMCNKFNATHLSMIDMYNKYSKINNKIINKKQMVSLSILIRDTKKESVDYINVNGKINDFDMVLLGNEEEILLDIKNLEKNGVTDIIISRYLNDPEEDRVHSFIKQISKGL